MKNSEQPVRIIDNTHLYPVLTKREYFAAMAMQGVLGKETFKDSVTNATIAKFCVVMADELLKQLENQ